MEKSKFDIEYLEFIKKYLKQLKYLNINGTPARITNHNGIIEVNKSLFCPDKNTPEWHKNNIKIIPCFTLCDSGYNGSYLLSNEIEIDKVKKGLEHIERKFKDLQDSVEYCENPENNIEFNRVQTIHAEAILWNSINKIKEKYKL